MSDKNSNYSYYEAAGEKKKKSVFVKHFYIIVRTATENLWGILSLLFSVSKDNLGSHQYLFINCAINETEPWRKVMP